MEEPLSYWIAVARMGFEDDFHRLYEELGISQAELAKRIPASEAYVSRILNGSKGNYNLQTMAKWARAVGGVVQVRVIKEEGEAVRVVDYETARALDERQVTGAAYSTATSNKVVQLEDYRKERFERVLTVVSSESERNHG